MWQGLESADSDVISYLMKTKTWIYSLTWLAATVLAVVLAMLAPDESRIERHAAAQTGSVIGR